MSCKKTSGGRKEGRLSCHQKTFNDRQNLPPQKLHLKAGYLAIVQITERRPDNRAVKSFLLLAFGVMVAAGIGLGQRAHLGVAAQTFHDLLAETSDTIRSAGHEDDLVAGLVAELGKGLEILRHHEHVHEGLLTHARIRGLRLFDRLLGAVDDG